MKLNKRKNFLVFILLLLAITVVLSIVLIVNKNQKASPPSTPKESSYSNNESILAKNKVETISLLEEKLISSNVKNEHLLQELKNEHILNAGETNLREFLNRATTSADLETRKNKVIKIIEALTNKVPSPTQTPSNSPDNDTPPPQFARPNRKQQ